MFLKICPVCHRYPVDPGESDCGCVAEEKQSDNRWIELFTDGECGQMEFNLGVKKDE